MKYAYNANGERITHSQWALSEQSVFDMPPQLDPEIVIPVKQSVDGRVAHFRYHSDSARSNNESHLHMLLKQNARQLVERVVDDIPDDVVFHVERRCIDGSRIQPDVSFTLDGQLYAVEVVVSHDLEDINKCTYLFHETVVIRISAPDVSNIHDDSLTGIDSLGNVVVKVVDLAGELIESKGLLRLARMEQAEHVRATQLEVLKQRHQEKTEILGGRISKYQNQLLSLKQKRRRCLFDNAIQAKNNEAVFHELTLRIQSIDSKIIAIKAQDKAERKTHPRRVALLRAEHDKMVVGKMRAYMAELEAETLCCADSNNLVLSLHGEWLTQYQGLRAGTIVLSKDERTAFMASRPRLDDLPLTRNHEQKLWNKRVELEAMWAEPSDYVSPYDTERRELENEERELMNLRSQTPIDPDTTSEWDDAIEETIDNLNDMHEQFGAHDNVNWKQVARQFAPTLTEDEELRAVNKATEQLFANYINADTIR